MSQNIIGQTVKGRDKSVSVERDAVVLSYGKAFHGFKGDKRIPYKRITAVQFREPGFLLAGYIQFSIQGAVEWHGPIVQDENAVLFEKSETAQFKALKDFIDEVMARAEGAAPVTISIADELAKLADLKSQGVITEDEFNAQKARLLSR